MRSKKARKLRDEQAIARKRVATLTARYGPDYFKQLGAAGGCATFCKHGSEHMSELNYMAYTGGNLVLYGDTPRDYIHPWMRGQLAESEADLLGDIEQTSLFEEGDFFVSLPLRSGATITGGTHDQRTSQVGVASYGSQQGGTDRSDPSHHEPQRDRADGRATTEHQRGQAA